MAWIGTARSAAGSWECPGGRRFFARGRWPEQALGGPRKNWPEQALGGPRESWA